MIVMATKEASRQAANAGWLPASFLAVAMTRAHARPVIATKEAIQRRDTG
jgi:hypothetical protein